jgi:hypothetical protein
MDCSGSNPRRNLLGALSQTANMAVHRSVGAITIDECQLLAERILRAANP